MRSPEENFAGYDGAAHGGAMTPPTPLPPILPIGTAVVVLEEHRDRDGLLRLARGSTGSVVRAPEQADKTYRVRFPGGEVHSLRRRDFEVLSRFQTSGGDPLKAHDLGEYVIYRCVIGSRAYGLEQDGSDTDRRGVYLPPADMHWSLFGVPEQLERKDTEECYWEIEKFLRLALKANPNILEVLYSPIVEHITKVGRELLDLREAFLSKLVYPTYNGYVLSQFKKIEQRRRRGEPVKVKHAMHLIRLLLSGIGVLRDRCVPVRVEEHRDRLLAIRCGEVAWEEVDEWRLDLHREFDREYARTRLPDHPDFVAADAFLRRSRRAMVDAAQDPPEVQGTASP